MLDISPTRPADAAPPTILVVDDDDMVVGTLTLLLEDEGYRVAVATDGVQGRAAYAEIGPDLVITDMIMPRESGMALCAGIRQADPSAKIIAISGSGHIRHVDFLEMAQTLGADTVIAKPFDPEEVLGAVRSLLAPLSRAAAA